MWHGAARGTARPLALARGWQSKGCLKYTTGRPQVAGGRARWGEKPVCASRGVGRCFQTFAYWPVSSQSNVSLRSLDLPRSSSGSDHAVLESLLSVARFQNQVQAFLLQGSGSAVSWAETTQAPSLFHLPVLLPSNPRRRARGAGPATTHGIRWPLSCSKMLCQLLPCLGCSALFSTLSGLFRVWLIKHLGAASSSVNSLHAEGCLSLGTVCSKFPSILLQQRLYVSFLVFWFSKCLSRNGIFS